MQELADNYAKTMEAGAAFDCDFVTVEARLSHGFPLTWYVAMHKKDQCVLNSDQSFAVALNKCAEQAKMWPNMCKICGGRMDGPCQHSH